MESDTDLGTRNVACQVPFVVRESANGKRFRQVSVICFISQWMKRSKHGLFIFRPIWRRHCSIGQSCCSMTSKRSSGWFLENSRAWSFYTRVFAQLKACLHGVGDLGLVGLVSFVFTLWGHKTKESYPTRPGSPSPRKQGLTKSNARLYPLDKPIKSLYFRSFVVSVLFAHFHLKVMQKPL